MAITMDGIFINGQKVTFAPENILAGDASAYAQEIGAAVEAWMEENVTGGEQVTDTTLTLPGVPADAKVTGDKVDELNVIFTSVPYAFTYYQGTISTQNGVPSSTIVYNRIYTDFGEIEEQKINVAPADGYKWSLRFYDSDKTFVSSTGWSEQEEQVASTVGYFVRFVYAHADDTDLDPSEGSNVVVTQRKATDKTLSNDGKPADAKAVGDALAQKASIDTESRLNKLQENIKGYRYAIQEPTETTEAHYISKTGVYSVLGSGNTNYKVAKYDVESGEKYVISGSCYGTTCAYSFYGSDSTPLSWYAPSESSSGITDVSERIVIAPYGSTILYVAYIIKHQDGSLGVGVTGWTGLKWAAMGDSITDANNSRATKRYFDYISDSMGISVVNLGKSGTGYKKPYNNNLPFYQRIDTIPLDSDVITIFGSGNDLSLALGNPTDTTDATICGCINLTIDGIRDRILGANLGIITPTPWVQYPTTTAGNKMDLYCDAIIEICRLKGVPCLDLYHCSNMLPWESNFRTAFYKHDDGNGVHPDEDGHKLFAPKIKAFLNTLLM